MSSLEEIQKQIKELQEQAKSLIEAEKANVIDDMKAKIIVYGITAQELGFICEPVKEVKSKSSGTGTSKAPLVAMYRNKDKENNPTDETWSGGKGARPKWVQEIYNTQTHDLDPAQRLIELHHYLRENGYKV